jgi:hypothetical protein
MRELVAKTIDGRLYEFEQFKTSTAVRVLAKLTKVLGEPLAVAMSSFFKASKGSNEAQKLDPETGVPISSRRMLDQEVDPNALAKAVGLLIERLDEVDVVDLIEQLVAKSVLCDHKPVIFEMHYQGDIGHLFRVIAAALEVQYGNFIDAITGPLLQAKAMAAGIRRA